MPLQCPVCQTRVPLNDVNVAADTALCRACGTPLSYSELVDSMATAPGLQPRGTWRVDDGFSLRIGASCRSWMALPLIGFNAFWNGIVWTFIVAGLKSGQYWILLFVSLHATVGLVMLWALLLTIAGRVEVALSGDRGTVFTGIGPLGLRRRFDPRSVRAVRNEVTQHGRGGSQRRIVIDADRRVKLGTYLADDRREWLRAALAQTLLHPRKGLLR